jgi:hypothetical protein
VELLQRALHLIRSTFFGFFFSPHVERTVSVTLGRKILTLGGSEEREREGC